LKDRADIAFDRAKRLLLPGREALETLASQNRLVDSQWLSPARLATHQLTALKALVGFAVHSTEIYRGYDAGAVAAATTLEAALAAIPLLPRGSLARHPERFRPAALPPGHVATGTRSSSGTSGQVVRIETTNLVYIWQNALNLRAQLWAGRDFAQSIAVIRNDRRAPAPWPDGVRLPNWGAPEVFPFATGPSHYLGTASSLEQQWDWLSRIRPTYLMAYPSIVRAFAARARTEGRGPCPLEGISTVGETVDADLRDEAERYLGAEVHDLYSSEEAGVMALQCPTCRSYHSQDEALIFEILDENGRPASPGTTGRVVVTPLFNFATPLIRYEIGDLAEAGAPCACGRGLGTINRIVGRYRNVFRTADGRTFWPSLGTKKFPASVVVRQHQFRQVSYDRLEVVLALEKPLTAEEEDEIRRTIEKRMPVPMQVTLSYADEIPREASGKYQEFVCLVQ
jgi:phenylacetate-CoA ligase